MPDGDPVLPISGRGMLGGAPKFGRGGIAGVGMVGGVKLGLGMFGVLPKFGRVGMLGAAGRDPGNPGCPG